MATAARDDIRLPAPTECPEMPRPKSPYVGLRAFKAEERVLFRGREQDASLLKDQILAARVSVLYGRSGLGKTSLLQALVIPEVERNNAYVLKFDEWSQKDPVEALVHAVEQFAVENGVELRTREPSSRLVDVVREFASLSGKTIVLVLDQLEELLVKRAGNVNDIRKELGSVIRATKVSHLR